MVKVNRSRAFKLYGTAAVAVMAIALLGLPAWGQSYQATILTSDIANISENTDTNLVNPWGLAAGPSTYWWVADNGTGLSTLYDGMGVPQSLVVSIPSFDQSGPGNPTGIAFNSTSDFELAPGKPAFFLFVTEDGTVQGWNPDVNLNSTIIKVINNGNAIYKGMAVASANGANFIYATNFFAGKIDVFDKSFNQVSGFSFLNPNLPPNLSPFNIQLIDGNLIVAYAKPDEDGEDDVPGPGNGWVDVFDTQGNLIRSLPHILQMNAPWAIVKAPADFGAFSNDLLIGNFGSGSIMGFDANTGNFIGLMLDEADLQLRIDGLWALQFGNGGNAGPMNTLFFTAGNFDETHGTFGSIVPLPGQGVAVPQHQSSFARRSPEHLLRPRR